MIGFQAEGAAPIFHNEVVTRPETVATAIRIGNPANWSHAVQAIEESGGLIDIVSDEEILEAQLWLARNEGIFVEPASAAPIAGLRRAVIGRGRLTSASIPEGSKIVCTVTGNGLKDPEIVSRRISLPPPIAPNEKEILRVLDSPQS
jgi:threonine synthase